MKEKNITNHIANAAKWSTISEIAVKIISPVTNMFLARILAPDAFGVVAVATMIVSFADMFSDAGFQKYLIQHEFLNEKDEKAYANVAFWTNLSVSIVLWVIIFFNREFIARLVGNPGLGFVISIASLEILISSFSSIQMAIYRRKFDFKTLFYSRISSAMMPIIVTLPLAFLGMGYWSIIIGNLARRLVEAFVLVRNSTWKPKFCYSFNILKKMFSFSMWSLVEALSIWLTTWVDSFIIGKFLSPYYLGLYKNSTSMVNALFSIITGATTPVLFSSLSRLQNDDSEFNEIFLQFQKIVSIIVFPLGMGVFLYSEFATKILLGERWIEASKVIGIWALTSALMIVLGNYCSELYRAKGRPKLSFLAQILHLLFLIPICIISARNGFWALVYTRSLMRLQFILVHLVIMKYVIKFPIKRIFNNILPAVLSATIMFIIGYFIKQINQAFYWNFIGIGICIIIYAICLFTFPSVRSDIRKVINYKI